MLPTLATNITIDVERLVETRLLTQANSGAGKSHTLRRLLEQTYGAVQHIVIDVEGEFHTLREKYDYVLAAPKGGDCRADTGTAALLARRLLELGVSTIIDIYELGAKQALFVKLFLDSLMSAPRDLWHPVLVVVDEAHKFCPEKGDAVSADAVIDLMTRGRKRGFSGVLATQRLSKLDKDAAAEANNLLIGRTALDLDIARAASVLGMTLKDARAILPKLTPGEFYVVGPALTTTVERVRIGDVVTTHPKAGTRGSLPTPPRAKVREMLAKLADLPAEAEAEATTVSQLRARVRELETKNQRLERGSADDGVRREDFFDKVRTINELTAQLNDEKLYTTEQEQLLETVVTEIDAAVTGFTGLLDRLTYLRNKVPDMIDRVVKPAPAMKSSSSPVIRTMAEPVVINDRGQRVNGTDALPAMPRAFLTALAQYGPLSKRKLLVYTGYSRGGATSKCFADLNKTGYARASGNDLLITSDGLSALGRYEPLPMGMALRQKIERELPDMERAIFKAVCLSYPAAVTKHSILEHTGYSRGGATSKAFAYLVARDYLVAHGPGELRAAEELFE